MLPPLLDNELKLSKIDDDCRHDLISRFINFNDVLVPKLIGYPD
jgi:hypothetical protein